MEVEPDFESLPGADWDDDGIEDPWEIEFPSKTKNSSSNKSKRKGSSEGAEDSEQRVTRVPEILPKLDESGLFTKIAKKTWQCNECMR